jgi:hypothetical protein
MVSHNGASNLTSDYTHQRHGILGDADLRFVYGQFTGHNKAPRPERSGAPGHRSGAMASWAGRRRAIEVLQHFPALAEGGRRDLLEARRSHGSSAQRGTSRNA